MSKSEQKEERTAAERSTDVSSNIPPQIDSTTESCEQKSSEARERILNAAQSLFAAHGFSATTTKAIAQQAGVPVSLIFYYFPNKKALLAEVINEHNMLAELRNAVEMLDITSPRSALIILGCRYITILQRHAELTSIQLREFRSHNEVAAQFRALRAEHIELITSLLEKTLQPGQYGTLPNLQMRARLFLYGLLESTVIDDIADPLQFVEQMTDVLLTGLSPNHIS
ncbi:MAG TPA: TetR/AcrR family transcriptional regulator [Ktedonobacteraceae bacterium]|jgi:AcrR family transcriptional regulator|nr:TetR/AcrR family transcriptional regulator [Ktedonobacteraceae bacterium]